MLHACDERFDVTDTVEKFWELNGTFIFAALLMQIPAAALATAFQWPYVVFSTRKY